MISLVILIAVLAADPQVPLAERLKNYSQNARDIPTFAQVEGEPLTVDRELILHSDSYLYQRYGELVGATPRSVRVISVSHSFARSSTTEYAAGNLRLDTSIYSDAKFGRLMADPTMAMVSRIGAYRVGTFSGCGLGEVSWFTAPTTRPDLDRHHKLIAVDGKVSVHAGLSLQPSDPNAIDPGWRPLTKVDYSVTEYAARLALSNGLMAEMDFQRLQNVGVRIADAAIVGKRSPEGNVFVPLRRTLRAVAGRLSANDWGFYTATVGSRKVALVIASRELVVGEKRITLPLPVLFDGTELWVEKYGLASALGIEIR
ncbi:MAG: hypothetical protein KIT74_04390 [Fimbriimonadales bacterium]|nr:hypothetical protein [Fimbriimonadales bacterium]